MLITPPVYDFAYFDLFSKPLGLLRIASWLKRGGWETVHVNALDYGDKLSLNRFGSPRRKGNGTGKIFRQPLEWPAERIAIERQYARYGIDRESFSSQIARSRPDLILITSTMTYWYEGIGETVDLCRRHHPGVPVAVGGIYATLMPDHCRDVCRPDYVLTGEGSQALREALGGSLPLPAEEISDVADPEDPVWRESGVIRLNRGCPMACDYCASRLLEPVFLAGRAEEAFQRLKEMHGRWGTTHFAVYDDALLVNRENLIKPFLEMVLSWGRNLSFYLPNAVHARYLDRELLNMMEAAGFRELRMGYESSSDDFHEKRDRKINRDIFDNAVEEIRNSAFPLQNCAAYVLAGLPGQRSSEVEHSVRTASAYGIRCRIAQYSPVPGSSLWEESLSFSSLPLKEEPVYHNNTFFSMEWEGFTRDELERIKRLTKELSPS